ncbi:GapA-binding peptide SR1P [Brevibacterium sp. JNUCC-42]|nr:GapA-binding peptide SR1P [Brevibacterium sp. JNUCC-42]
MTTIVCQKCGDIIEHLESPQVKTLYGVCDCPCHQHDNEHE